MTLGSLWGPASPASPSYVDQYSPASSKYYAGERGDTGGGYPFSGSVSQMKSKKDKKQAAMSAMTLIAFLFFLNILKECIQAEMHPPTAMIMMVPSPTLDALTKEETEPMGKYEEVDLKTKDDFVKIRKLFSVQEEEEAENNPEERIMERESELESEESSAGTFEEVKFKPRDDTVKFRKLLSLSNKDDDDDGNEEKDDGDITEGEFDIKMGKWALAREPEEGSDEDDFSNAVRIRKLLAVQDEEEGEEGRQGKFIKNFETGKRDWTNELSQISEEELVRQRQKLDQLRKLWKKQTVDEIKMKKTTMNEEVDRIKVKKFVNSPVLSDLKGIPKLSQYWAKQKTTTSAPETKSVDFEEHPKKVADFQEFETLDGENKSFELLEGHSEKLNDVAQSLQLRAAPMAEVELVADAFTQEDALNTPRYRRSDEILTTLATEELFRPEGVQVVTPNPTTMPPAFSTTRMYHVYTNPSQIYSNIWKTTMPPTTTMMTTTPTSTTGKMDIDEIYFTTTMPAIQRYQPMMYPNHRPSYKPLSRYRYSPNRRVAYEAPAVRQEYYPMSVVGQYGGEEDTSSLGGVLQLIWTLVSSFARPISRIIPQMSSKVGGEAQCFDLLACEAHRLGNYMGPTAKAVATTFSSVLQWVTPPSDKPALDAAIAAGQENTCFEQISACDDRSGGKSAMTMVAQLMELRGENSRRPRS